MFKLKDYVFHTHCGVCLVTDIAPLPGDNSGNLYYVLRPLYGDDKGNIVRVLVKNSSSLREPYTKKDILKMIESWPSIKQDLYIVDSKRRKTCYESVLSTGNVNEMGPLIYGAKQRKAKDGHLNAMDAMFVSRAEPILYGSVALALKLKFEDVPAYLEEKLS
ncbi:MAG: CarD family transcriptional regulator [Bacilli bacterium]|nr:CarD family transcriptional regulator [Bacilli bacterium]MDY6430846.1 CarD family transcriptional regulator [Bacilli bacterium]